ncbi:MAG: class I SAM-dependent methyltransferase [Lachnospiraceae bacterium]|nr:class I SAM-dependent methyltransferase [Lachnospiraceae bacterium]
MGEEPEKSYQDINAETIDRWIEEGWEWGQSISHEDYVNAVNGEWDVVLTPQKPVPHEWFGELKGKRVLGLASGGGQQMPIFAALGAECTVLDYSPRQLESERLIAEREGYDIEIIRADMTKPLPFADESFDLIFAPVSTCYIEDVRPLHKECARILKDGGVLLGGYDQVVNYIFDDSENTLTYTLPFNPLKDKSQMDMLQQGDYGVQFSHTLEEQLGGLIEAGFTITGLYEDMSSDGNLAKHNIPNFYAVRAQKQ